MGEHQLEKEMSFRGGTAVFFAKAKQGVCWPLGSERRVLIDGELIGGGGTPAYFQDHLWATDSDRLAAGMVKQNHFMDPEGYVLDPACLPLEAQSVWPSLDRKGRQKLALALINGVDPSEAVSALPAPIPAKVSADTAPKTETISCPVCDLKVEDEPDAGKARAAILVHQRLMHPNWQG